MTRVVNLYHERGDVYCGRAGKGRDGYFGNPHVIGECPCGVTHDRADALECYAQYFQQRLRTDVDFRSRVRAIKDKTLECFCRPKVGFNGKLLCHCQIIAGYLDGMPPEQVL